MGSADEMPGQLLRNALRAKSRTTTGSCTCYSMSMSLDHRLQILIDDDRHRRITTAARERGVSVATIVREAIDRGLGSPERKRSAAGRRLLDAPDMPVPEPRDLRNELDGLRARHE
jgi:hypothetical protein